MTAFWQTTALKDMTHEQWESLCDGCGQCCLLKLIDEDDSRDPPEIFTTNIACHLLDKATARCGDYPHRSQRVPSCVTLTPENLEDVYFMPETCAYRMLAEGLELPYWHPLRHNGSQQEMREAGISVVGHFTSEKDFHGDLEDRIVTFPLGND